MNYWLKAITKKVIYSSMKKEQRPHLLNVKSEIKTFYYEEIYRCYIKGKGTLFEKQYILLLNIFSKTN